MSIRDLPDKWRERYAKGRIVGQLRFADELQAELPTWTKITDSEDTWPEDEHYILMLMDGKRIPSIKQWYSPADEPPIGNLNAHWRPLIDLDYPPETGK